MQGPCQVEAMEKRLIVANAYQAERGRERTNPTDMAAANAAKGVKTAGGGCCRRDAEGIKARQMLRWPLNPTGTWKDAEFA
jgi:hypothetical protein